MIDMTKLADRLAELIEAGGAPEDTWQTARREFGCTWPQFAAACEVAIDHCHAAAAKKQREAAALAELLELCRPAFEDGSARTIGEAIDVLTARGDERAAAIQAALGRAA